MFLKRITLKRNFRVSGKYFNKSNMEKDKKIEKISGRNKMMKLWFNLHAYLSMFFLPVALMVAVTGFMNVTGYTGYIDTQEYKLILDQSLPRPLSENLEAQEKVMLDFARENNIAIPEGTVRKGKQGVILGDATGYHFNLIPSRMEDTAQLNVNHPGLFYKMLMLHKSKCGFYFKILMFGLGITMVLLYLSGIFLIWKNRKMRSKLLLCCGIGIIVTVLAGWLSL